MDGREIAITKFRLTGVEALGQAAECLRMVLILLQGDYTVSERAEACELPGAMATEHQRLMHCCGLPTSENDGRMVYCRVAEPHLKNILKCVEDRIGVNTDS